MMSAHWADKNVKQRAGQWVVVMLSLIQQMVQVDQEYCRYTSGRDTRLILSCSAAGIYDRVVCLCESSISFFVFVLFLLVPFTFFCSLHLKSMMYKPAHLFGPIPAFKLDNHAED